MLLAMAHGAIREFAATLAVSITGVADPAAERLQSLWDWFILPVPDRNGATRHREERFGDIGRAGVRTASVEVALELLEAQVL